MCRGPLLGSSILAMGCSCKRGIYTCDGWQHVVKQTDAAPVQSDKWSSDIGIGQQLGISLSHHFFLSSSPVFQRGCLTSCGKRALARDAEDWGHCQLMEENVGREETQSSPPPLTPPLTNCSNVFLAGRVENWTNCTTLHQKSTRVYQTVLCCFIAYRILPFM